MRRLLTIKEAANRIEGLTVYCIRQMLKSGELKCFKSGNKNLIPEEALYKAVFGEAPEDGEDQ